MSGPAEADDAAPTKSVDQQAVAHSENDDSEKSSWRISAEFISKITKIATTLMGIHDKVGALEKENVSLRGQVGALTRELDRLTGMVEILPRHVELAVENEVRKQLGNEKRLTDT